MPYLIEWIDAPQALAWRHALLVEEMRLQGLDHKSPIDNFRVATVWPSSGHSATINSQFELIKTTSTDARLTICDSSDALMQQNAYSLMARDPRLYKYLQTENRSGRLQIAPLQEEITAVMKQPVTRETYERVINSMWRYCQKAPEAATFTSSAERPARRIRTIQFLADKYRWPELWLSTAITDLACCAILDE